MLNVLTRIWLNDHQPPKKEIIARLGCAILAIVTTACALLAPTTFTHAMLILGGAPAVAGVFAVGVLGVLLLADTLVNEILPIEYIYPWARRYRQGMWMTLGCLEMIFAFLVFTNNLSVSLGCYLIVFGLGAQSLAFVDAATEKMVRRGQCLET